MTPHTPTGADTARGESTGLSAHLPAFPLEQILTAHELAARPNRVPDYKAENEALTAIADAMTVSPDDVLQILVDKALALTNAQSAGISLLERDSGAQVFRWQATAGEYARHLGQTLPRALSPCDAVLHRKTMLLMTDPVRRYPLIHQLSRPVHELLLVPFFQGAQPVGTIWVVLHDAPMTFMQEDARVVQSLAKLAGAAFQLLSQLDDLRAVNHAVLSKIAEPALAAVKIGASVRL